MLTIRNIVRILLTIVVHHSVRLPTAFAETNDTPSQTLPREKIPDSEQNQADSVALGRRFFELGVTLYEQGDYEGALTQFELSYKHAPRPPLIFNIGRCHESLGQLDKAIKAYETFMQQTDGKTYAIQRRIANLRKRRQAQKAQTNPADADQQQHGASIQRHQPSSSQSSEITMQKPTTAHRTHRLDRVAAPSPMWPLYTGWAAVGTGGIMLTLGGVFAGLVKSKENDLENAARSGAEYADHRNTEQTARRFEKAEIGLFAAGGVFALAGVGLLLWHYLDEERPKQSIHVQPAVGTRGVAFNLSTTF